MVFENPFNEDDVKRSNKVPTTAALVARSTYTGIQAFTRFVDEQLAPVLRGLLNPSDRDNVILAIYYRVVALLKSLLKLDAPGDFQSIAAASRSIFELYLDLVVLTRDTSGDSVRRFHSFTRVERFRVAEKIVTFFDASPTVSHRNVSAERALVTNRTERAAIEQEVEQLWGRDSRGRLLWPKHWSRYQDARARANALGPSFEALYVSNYYELSWHVSGLRLVDLQLQELGEPQRFSL